MKKVFILFLSMVLVFCMTACGEKKGSSSTPKNTDDAKDPKVTVTIDGMSYNEKEYVHYLDITITNNNSKAINGYDLSVLLNGYLFETNCSFNADANTTINTQIKIERPWIVYYYNLCNLTEIDKAAVTLQILDKETSSDMGVASAEAKIEKFVFDKTNFSIPEFKADVKTKVYSDDKCEITLLAFNTNSFSIPSAYLLVENKNIADEVFLDYKRDSANSYSEIIDNINNDGEDIVAEINGKQVACGKFVGWPGDGGLSKGNKALVPIEIHIDKADISLKDITSFKKDFVIENQDTLNNIIYAEVNLNWTR